MRGGTATVDSQDDLQQLWQAAKNNVIYRAYKEHWDRRRVAQELEDAQRWLSELPDVETAFSDGKSIAQSIPQLFDETGKFVPVEEALDDPELFYSLYGALDENGLLDRNIPGFYPMIVKKPKLNFSIDVKKNGGYLNYFK